MGSSRDLSLVIKPGAAAMGRRFRRLTKQVFAAGTFSGRSTLAKAGSASAGRRNRCGTPSRRFQNIDSEGRGLVPSLGVTEPRANAKLNIKTWKTPLPAPLHLRSVEDT